MLELAVPEPGTAQAFLLVLSGAEAGRLILLDQPEMFIGRSRRCQIRVNERALSQQHAKLVPQGQGHLLLDLGSTNGTYVNDQRIQHVHLRVGDVIRTGETVMTYMSSAQAGDESTLALHQQAAPRPTTLAPMGPTLPAQAAGAAPGMMPYGTPPGGVMAPAMGQVVDLRETDDGPDMVTQLLRLLGFLRRYWLSMFVFALLGGAIGAASYELRPPASKALFEVSLVPRPSDNPVHNMPRYNFEFFRSAQLNFRRPALIAQTLEKLGAQDVSAERLRSLQKRLEFERASQYTFTGGFTDGDADYAIEFLDTHVELYLQTEIDKALAVLVTEVETLQKQVDDAGAKLTKTDNDLLAFKKQNLEALPEQARHYYQTLLDLNTARGTAQSELARARTDLSFGRQRLKGESAVLESRVATIRPYQDSIADLNRQIAEMQARGIGKDHPDLRRLKSERDQLEKLARRVLDKGDRVTSRSKNPAYEALKTNLKALESSADIARSEVARISKDIADTKGVVAKLPELEAKYAELTRDYEANQQMHTHLIQKLNASKIQLELERNQARTRYDIITPPNVEPVSKTKTMIIRGAGMAFAGLILAIGLGVLRELSRYVRKRAKAMGRA